MIAAGIIAKGKAKSLVGLVNDLEKKFDEVVIVDNGLEGDYSFKSPKIKIFKKNLQDFSSLRNFILEKADSDWIFFIDIDERPEKKLIREVRLAIESTKDTVAFYIRRREFFGEKEVKFGEVWKTRRLGIVRLVKKNSGYWKGKVHEVFIAKGKVGRLKGCLLHSSHASISDFLEKVNFYSTLRAKELYEEGRKFVFWQLLLLPFFKFFYTYFFLLGFLDGYAGFVYSFMMSFHSFLSRAKLYQYQNFEG